MNESVTTTSDVQQLGQQAFEKAKVGYEVFGIDLEPFSSLRQAAAATMGLRFGLVDEQDIFRVSVDTLREGRQELSFYNQMFTDVVFVIWLCTVPKSRVFRALRKVDEAKGEAFDWADERGISLTSKPYFEAAGVFFEIMKDIVVSTVVPDVEPIIGDEEEEEESPNE
jgi:hypothetical protein